MKGRINPRIDIAFKKIFGTDSNKDLLISLINSIVSAQDQVTDLILLNPYNQKNVTNDKLSILDIKAEGADGKKFNVEIQITDEADYDKRALYYWAKLYSDQLKESDDYSSLEKVIGIHILNFLSIPEVEKYHNAFHVTEKETGLPYFKEFELHTIELKKFTDSLGSKFEDIGSKITSSLDLWSTFLTKNDLLTEAKIPKFLDNAPVKKAMEVLTIMDFSEEEREVYEAHLKWLRIEGNTLKKAEEKGLEKGIEKGREEGQKAKSQAIALTLSQKRFTPREVAALTGLSKEETKKLADCAEREKV